MKVKITKGAKSGQAGTVILSINEKHFESFWNYLLIKLDNTNKVIKILEGSTEALL